MTTDFHPVPVPPRESARAKRSTRLAKQPTVSPLDVAVPLPEGVWKVSAVWLTRPIPTHTRIWPAGSRFAQAIWFEDADGEEVANVYDGAGELRISCVPGEAIRADGSWPVASTEARGHREPVGLLRRDAAATPAAPSVPSCLGESSSGYGESCENSALSAGHQPSLDPNAELALASRDKSVLNERCPFDPTGEIQPSAISDQPDEPVRWKNIIPPDRYYDRQQLAEHDRACWSAWSAEHHYRAAWGPEWTISPAGFRASQDRTLFYAGRSDRPAPREGTSWAKYDSPEWRFLVDLDRGEFCEWGSGAWTRLQTTSGTIQTIPLSGTIQAGADCVSAAGGKDPTAPLAADDVSPAKAPDGFSNRLFPDPHPGMSLDERRGWRRVDNTWRFGPGPTERLADWQAWLVRVTSFFVNTPQGAT